MTHPFLKMVFWLSSAAAAFTWAGYPLALWLLTRRRRRGSEPAPADGLPSVSIALVVHNEEAVVEAALADLLSLRYPPGLSEIIVVSDGSTDATDRIVAGYSGAGVRLVAMPRGGVTRALARGVEEARHEIVVRSDADTRHEPDYLLCLLRHYADPKVGCVGGNLTFVNVDETGVTRSQGLYWRFEMFLRQAESDLGVLSTMSSAVMSFRRELFEPFSSALSEDVVIPKLAVKKGYRVVQEPAAAAYEVMPMTLAGEFWSRRRMVARGVPALLSAEGALDPLRYPGHWAAAMSHKLLRWCTPVFLAGSFASSLALSRRMLYRLAACAHAGVYASGCIGLWLERRNRHLQPFSGALGFCLANVAFLAGLLDAARGRQVSTFQSQE